MGDIPDRGDASQKRLIAGFAAATYSRSPSILNSA
jgi:hypothetical protein